MVAWTLAIPAAVTLTILPCVFRGIRFRQVREHVFWDSKTLQSRGQGVLVLIRTRASPNLILHIRV